MSGAFYPKKTIGKLFHTSTLRYNNEALEYLQKQKGQVICLNDSEDEIDWEPGGRIDAGVEMVRAFLFRWLYSVVLSSIPCLC
jgi:hypothetical protein